MDRDRIRIAVVGLGGVGGYLAGVLGQMFPHLTVVARGARKKAVEENGIVVHGDFSGELVTRPEAVVSDASLLGTQDVIFICVKNYSLEQACESLKGHVGPETIVIPVMNGVDPAERTAKALATPNVLHAVIYIVAFVNKDYSVTQQGKFATIRIGAEEAALNARAQEFVPLMNCTGLKADVPGDILAQVWRKYILNCAYNVMTARYDLPVGPLREDPEKAEEYRALLEETWLLSKAEGVNLPHEKIDEMYGSFLHEMRSDATSSLQRDVEAGKQSELETFSGYAVREGERLGVPMPVSKRMYEALKKKGCA